MASLNGFNAAEVEPSKGFDPLPVGDYVAMIVDSEEKTTQAGTGTYIKLTVEIVDGEYKGRKLWENLNLNNPSAEAVAIAKATLSAICRAVGVLTPRDTVELHNIPMTVKIGLEKRKDSGEMQNRIKAFKPRVDASAITTPTTAAASGGGAAPWLKKV